MPTKNETSRVKGAGTTIKTAVAGWAACAVSSVAGIAVILLAGRGAISELVLIALAGTVTWINGNFIQGMAPSVLAGTALAVSGVFGPPAQAAAGVAAAACVCIFISSVRASERRAQQAKEEAQRVLGLTRILCDAQSAREAVATTIAQISGCFACSAACVRFSPKGVPEPTFMQQTVEGRIVRREIADARAMAENLASLEDACLKGQEFFDWPMRSRGALVGALRIPADRASAMMPQETSLLKAMILTAADGIATASRRESALRSREVRASDSAGAELLRAVAGDMRSVHSRMLCSGEAPDAPDAGLAAATSRLAALAQESEQLALIREPGIRARLQDEDLSRIITPAVEQLTAAGGSCPVTVSVEDGLRVRADAKLLSRSISAMLECAIASVGEDSKLELSAFPAAPGETVGLAVSLRNQEGREVLPPEEAGCAVALSLCETGVRLHGTYLQSVFPPGSDGVLFSFTLQAAARVTALSGAVSEQSG